MFLSNVKRCQEYFLEVFGAFHKHHSFATAVVSDLAPRSKNAKASKQQGKEEGKGKAGGNDGGTKGNKGRTDQKKRTGKEKNDRNKIKERTHKRNRKQTRKTLKKKHLIQFNEVCIPLEDPP
jgi:hypothetical protein